MQWKKSYRKVNFDFKVCSAESQRDSPSLQKIHPDSMLVAQDFQNGGQFFLFRTPRQKKEINEPLQGGMEQFSPFSLL